MTLGLFDHLLAVVVLIVAPIAGARARADVERLLADRGADGRRVIYVRIIASQWSMAAATVAVWIASARPWASIGLAWPAGWGFIAVLVLTATVIGYCAWQLRRVHHDPAFAAQTREAAANLDTVLPSTPREMRLFTFVCATAGIVEELVFRGFLLWYLSAMVPLWVAVLVSAVAFGIAHLYQGVAAAIQTAIGALVFAGLYLLGGSLWLPMVLHGAWNYLQVRMVYDARTSVPIVPGG